MHHEAALSDLHAEFANFELPKSPDFDVAILAGDIVARGRLVARWARSPGRFGDKPIIQIAGNHEYYESVLDQEEAESVVRRKCMAFTSLIAMRL